MWDIRVVAHVLGDVINILGRADGSASSMTAIGQAPSGRTFRDLLPAITPHL